jgi:hypothetical protein
MNEVVPAEGAMSEAAMLASLHDIRLPASAAGGAFADVAAAVAIAAFAAVLVLGLLRLFTIPRAQGLSEEAIPLADDLIEAHRRVALLHRLKRVAPDIFSKLRARLYKPGAVTLEEIEREASRHV